jgi:fosfomycin resistance protein FosX
MVQGLSHLTFIVRDLDRMESILTTIFGARRVYASGEETFSLARERFFLIGGSPGDPDVPAPIWVAIMEGDELPSRTYNHVAFKIAETDYPVLLERVRALGLDMRESRQRVAGEGRSLYFHDADNHLFELHTGTLGERLKRYAEGR